jgi:hypothetical protein
MPADVPSNAVVRFGVFEVELRSGELRKAGVKVKIQELPFQALKLLLSRPNAVLSRYSSGPVAGRRLRRFRSRRHQRHQSFARCARRFCREPHLH